MTYIFFFFKNTKVKSYLRNTTYAFKKKINFNEVVLNRYILLYYILKKIIIIEGKS